MAEAAEKLALDTPEEEVGGIFFFPAVGTPMFLPIDNIHLEPEKHFQFDYVDMAQAIIETYGETRGTLSMFHSHPFGSGQPSRDDELAAEVIAKEMDGHPLWRPLERHMIFSLWDHSWWWYDLIAFGRVGWKWPEA